MKHFLFSLLLLATSAKAQDSISVLFIGNSYTYVNDLPSMLSQFAASKGDVVTQESKTNGGYTFQNHLNDPLTHSKIQSKPWDFVVLQGQSQEPSFPYSQVTSQTFPPAKSLTDSIFASNYCSQVLYFMTWGRKNGDPQWDSINTFDKMNTRLENAYLYMMNQAQSSVSPVAVAWKRVVDEHPEIELYSSDGSHPSLAGTYLATCVFYASLFRKSPMNSTFLAGLDTQTASILQGIADEVVISQLDTWKLRSKDKIALADFSFTQDENAFSFTNLSWRSTNFIWDFDDSNTSTETNPQHIYTLGGDFDVRLVSSNSCGSDTLIQTIQISTLNNSTNFSQEYMVQQHSDGTFTLSFNTNGSIEFEALFSSQGQVIENKHEFLTTITHDKYLLDLKGLPQGVYFVIFKTQSKLFSIKLIQN